MKRCFYLSLLFIGLGFSQPSQAQVSVNINIGSQPLWGPVGYDYVRYYYMPEIDVYYDVTSRKYTYYQGNKWVTKSKLPGRYKHFDVYRTYKVVLNDPSPWRYHNNHRRHYGHYAHNHTQVILRDGDRGRHGRHEERYNKKSHGKHKESKHHGRRNWDD
ncbi:hypothetical protein [Sphingobacterium yanglingense]|uniref:Uncharacterized protein n=1 Tax=Sphingobacterium yanglingense TaxID=1437280 RepID=A0A4R6WHN6_9SPHI|nr:hypothetical protein [Sphingobacterium yanglingense]TDQ78026.1 hypothetical protein CLV99_2002 [Sphingobacterium yanglingense]